MAMKPKSPAPRVPAMTPNTRLSPEKLKKVAQKIRKTKDGDGLESHGEKS